MCCFFFFVFFFFFFYFFFQAEDGIRDTSVTGVQTCALPICSIGSQLLFGWLDLISGTFFSIYSSKSSFATTIENISFLYKNTIKVNPNSISYNSNACYFTTGQHYPIICRTSNGTIVGKSQMVCYPGLRISL